MANHGSDEGEPSAAPAPAQFGNLAGAIGAKNLLIIIIAMPFVFLVVVLGIIALFGNPNDGKPVALDDETLLFPDGVPEGANVYAYPTQDGSGSVAVPVGAAPGAIALDGDRLAIRLDGQDGVTVVVYDLAKGEVIARIPFVNDADAATP